MTAQPHDGLPRLASANGTDARGVYGLQLPGVPAAREILRSADPSWPALQLDRVVAPVDMSARQRVSDHSAEFFLQGRIGRVELTRDPLRAQFSLDKAYGDPAIVHPFLAMTAAICSRWLGRDAFHAGAFEYAEGAWAVLGDKGAGKSSTLAELAARGIGIYADDVLVVEGGLVLPGPGCIDLRRDAAARRGEGVEMGVVGTRERWRLPVPPVTPRLPLRGWVFPTWGASIEMVPIPVHERLPMILGNLALRLVPLDPARILELAALPCWELRRPRDWAALDGALDEMLRCLVNTKDHGPGERLP